MGKDQRAQEDWSPRRTKNNETELIFKMTIWENFSEIKNGLVIHTEKAFYVLAKIYFEIYCNKNAGL